MYIDAHGVCYCPVRQHQTTMHVRMYLCMYVLVYAMCFFLIIIFCMLTNHNQTIACQKTEKNLGMIGIAVCTYI